MNSHNDVIAEIKNLQNVEKKLLFDLEKLPQSNDSLQEQNKIINQMIQNAGMRMSEFRKIQTIYNLLNKQNSQDKSELAQQMQQLNMIEDNLEKTKKHIESQRNINLNKVNSNSKNLRLSEINTYYSEKYAMQTQIVMRILYLCLPIIILVILSSMDLFPEEYLGYSITIIIVIGMFLVVPMIIDLYSRSNMVFSEYKFPSNMAQGHWEDDNDVDILADLGDMSLECIGPDCCSVGMDYDYDKEVCVLKDKQKGKISGQSTTSHKTDLMSRFDKDIDSIHF